MALSFMTDNSVVNYFEESHPISINTSCLWNAFSHILTATITSHRFLCFQLVFWMKELNHAIIKYNKAPNKVTEEYVLVLVL